MIRFGLELREEDGLINRYKDLLTNFHMAQKKQSSNLTKIINKNGEMKFFLKKSI